MNKYNAKRTYSKLLKREFASELEAKRAEELRLMELAGEIFGLDFQYKFVLCRSPKITYTVDFVYCDNNTKEIIYEDVKGVLTRDTRTKAAWVYDKFAKRVKITGESG